MNENNVKVNKHAILNWGGDPGPWKRHVHDELTAKFGQATAYFAMNSQLPADHTQNANKRYEQNGNKGFTYVPNQLPNMAGEIVSEKRYMTEYQYNHMKPADADEVVVEEEIVGDAAAAELGRLRSAIAAPLVNVTNNAVQNVKKYYRIFRFEKPIAMGEYKVLYKNDPFDPELAVRVKVSNNNLENLIKIERDWVEQLFKACASMRTFIDVRLMNVLEKDKRFVDAKLNGRIDYMIKLAISTVLKGSATEVIGQGTQRGRECLQELMNIDIGTTNPIVHLAYVDKVYQSLLTSGHDGEDRSTMTDNRSPMEYMMGQVLLWSVKSVFGPEITKCDSEDLISPKLHYLSAKLMIEQWIRDKESTIAGEIARNKGSNTSTAKIAAARQYDHSKGGGKGSKKIVKQTGKNGFKSSGNGNSDSNSIDDANLTYDLSNIVNEGFREFVAQNVCENCGVVGHMGHTCKHSKTTDQMREKSNETRLRKRKVREDSQA